MPHRSHEPVAPDQILSIVAMRAAEAALIAGGETVETLMAKAGQGAAEYVWRMAGGRSVTVLCGPGNNGGDGYVIAEVLRGRGVNVAVIAPHPPATDAAQAAAGYAGPVLPAEAARSGSVFVDALFGVGLTRPLEDADAALIARLAVAHSHVVAVDVPSGVDADTGNWLTKTPPRYDLTVALGAWKPAHALMPAVAGMGALRLVDIGVVEMGTTPDAPFGPGRMLRAPRTIDAPASDAHKYSRGCLAVVAGRMAGAAVLAARAAQGAGAGYVRIAAERPLPAPADLVVSAEALDDARNTAVLCGPGLGRDAGAEARLQAAIDAVLALRTPLVLDADALMLLRPKHLAGRNGLLPQRLGAVVLTPHEGELVALEKAWGLKGATVHGVASCKVARAIALAEATGAVVVAKGPDTIIAAPGGYGATPWIAHAGASSWLSTAGTGDVLAGCIASRLACGAGPFAAAAQGVWLQSEAAHLAGPAFHAMQLAEHVPIALAAAIRAA